MKIYRATIMDNDEGRCYSYGRNKTEAKQRMKEQMRQMGNAAIDEIEIEEIKLKSSAQDIADWLNAHFTRNNG